MFHASRYFLFLICIMENHAAVILIMKLCDIAICNWFVEAKIFYDFEI